MIKNKKIKWTICIAVYLIIGFSLYFIVGTPRGLTLREHVQSIITVMLIWPFLVAGQIFYN